MALSRQLRCWPMLVLAAVAAAPLLPGCTGGEPATPEGRAVAIRPVMTSTDSRGTKSLFASAVPTNSIPTTAPLPRQVSAPVSPWQRVAVKLSSPRAAMETYYRGLAVGDAAAARAAVEGDEMAMRYVDALAAFCAGAHDLNDAMTARFGVAGARANESFARAVDRLSDAELMQSLAEAEIRSSGDIAIVTPRIRRRPDSERSPVEPAPVVLRNEDGHWKLLVGSMRRHLLEAQAHDAEAAIQSNLKAGQAMRDLAHATTAGRFASVGEVWQSGAHEYDLAIARAYHPAVRIAPPPGRESVAVATPTPPVIVPPSNPTPPHPSPALPSPSLPSPSLGTLQPAPEQHTPLTDQHAPGEEAHTPATERNVSIPQVHTPAVEQHPSVPQTKAPGPIMSLPAPDVSLPAPETHTPTPDAPAPTPDAPAPTPDAPAPTPDAPAPTPDAPAPASETAHANSASPVATIAPHELIASAMPTPSQDITLVRPTTTLTEPGGPGHISPQAAPGTSQSEAVSQGRLEMVKQDLAKGIDVNAKDPLGRTALHRAAIGGEVEIVKLLLEKGADVNSRDSQGWTPLHWAASSGQAQVASMLLAKGAKVDVKGELGDTPLQWAVVFDRPEVTALLIDKGADISGRDNHGRTALHTAAEHDSKATAAVLLKKGANVNARDEHGLTPLHLAILHGRRELDEMDSAGDKAAGGDATTARAAMQQRNLQMISLLLDHGADVNCSTPHGATPLHMATWDGMGAVSEALIAHGADLAARDQHGKTPLAIANERAQKKAVAALTAAGAKE